MKYFCVTLEHMKLSPTSEQLECIRLEAIDQYRKSHPAAASLSDQQCLDELMREIEAEEAESATGSM